MRIRQILSAAGVLGVVGASLVGAPANAEKDDKDPLATLPTQSIATDVKKGAPLGATVKDAGSGLPPDILPAIAIAQSPKWGDAVNEIVWDREEQELLVFAATHQTDLTSALSSVKSKASTKVVPAFRSLAEIEEAVSQLLADGGQLPDGTPVAGWYPSDDGREVTFDLSESKLRSSSQNLPTQIDGIKIKFKFGQTTTPVTRVDNTAGVAGGAYMHGQGYACTTGFPIIRAQDQEPGNLTADHCGSGMSNNWWWGTGSSHLVGVTSGQAYTGSGMGTDLEMLVLGDSVTGVMAWGDHLNSWWYIPINGYFAAVVGQHVCYNGSRSGAVCSNQVTGTNYQACYDISLPCYRLTRTEQVLGTPAAGNGDSGGPVGTTGSRPSDSRFGFYGTGIISGMVNSTSACTGDPASATRECSSVALFAPVERFANNNTVWVLIVAA